MVKISNFRVLLIYSNDAGSESPGGEIAIKKSGQTVSSFVPSIDLAEITFGYIKNDHRAFMVHSIPKMLSKVARSLTVEHCLKIQRVLI